MARQHWHLAYTLVNNPQLVLCRKISEDNELLDDRKKKKKSKAVSVPRADYELYMKLKQRIKILEEQIYGEVIEKRKLSFGCQTDSNDETTCSINKQDSSELDFGGHKQSFDGKHSDETSNSLQLCIVIENLTNL